MKGIIFDLDGTMVDNMDIHHRAWQRLLAELGLDWDFEKVKKEVHGVNEEIIERLFGDRFSPEERRVISAKKEQEYRDTFLPKLKLIEGLDHFLQSLTKANIPLAIGTAAPAKNMDFVLDNLKIRHLFKATLNASHVSNGKPHPEIFLTAARQIGVAPEDCIVFEDSPTGAETAANTGCKSIIITSTHEQEEFKDFKNIIGFIEDYSDLKIEDIEKGRLP